jgi:hypothetical protein
LQLKGKSVAQGKPPLARVMNAGLGGLSVTPQPTFRQLRVILNKY